MKFQLIGICLLLFAFTSCADKKAQWLEQYAQTKCAYQTEVEKVKVDSIAQIPSLLAEKEKLLEQLLFISAPFEKKTKELNEGIKEAQREYMKAYRIAEQAQNAKFGHRDTPAYVKEISNLENKKAKKIESLQNKIAEVKSELENKNDYKSVIEKIKLQDEKIKAIQDGIIVKHKTVIDSLQELLNVQNSNFKRLKSELEPNEQTILESKRDSIRINPCQ